MSAVYQWPVGDILVNCRLNISHVSSITISVNCVNLAILRPNAFSLSDDINAILWWWKIIYRLSTMGRLSSNYWPSVDRLHRPSINCLLTVCLSISSDYWPSVNWYSVNYLWSIGKELVRYQWTKSRHTSWPIYQATVDWYVKWLSTNVLVERTYSNMIRGGYTIEYFSKSHGE